MNNLVLVFGTPRSGTHTMAHMLRKAGLRVRHEKDGIDGTVSFFYHLQETAELPPNWSKSPQHKDWDPYKFAVRATMVRHPLKGMSSLFHTMPGRNLRIHFERGSIPAEYNGRKEGQRLAAAMYLWVAMYDEILKYTRNFIKIEEIPRGVDFICRKLRMPQPHFSQDEVPRISKGKSQTRRLITWEEIANVDRHLQKRAQRYCKRFGYKL